MKDSKEKEGRKEEVCCLIDWKNWGNDFFFFSSPPNGLLVTVF